MALAHVGMDVLGVEPLDNGQFRVSIYDASRGKIWRRSVDPLAKMGKDSILQHTVSLQHKWFKRGRKEAV